MSGMTNPDPAAIARELGVDKLPVGSSVADEIRAATRNNRVWFRGKITATEERPPD